MDGFLAAAPRTTDIAAQLVGDVVASIVVGVFVGLAIGALIVLVGAGLIG